MEIIGADFAKICGFKSAHNIYMQFNQGKLTKSESGKYNIFDPLNSAFLKKHGKSRIDVENYIKNKPTPPKSYKKRKLEQKKQVESKKEEKEVNETLLLVEVVDYVITSNYSEEEAIKIKNQIFTELERRLDGNP